jgi:hypothetical protein
MWKKKFFAQVTPPSSTQAKFCLTPPRTGTVMYNRLSLEGDIHCIKASSLQGTILDMLEIPLSQQNV